MSHTPEEPHIQLQRLRRGAGVGCTQTPTRPTTRERINREYEATLESVGCRPTWKWRTVMETYKVINLRNTTYAELGCQLGMNILIEGDVMSGPYAEGYNVRGLGSGLRGQPKRDLRKGRQPKRLLSETEDNPHEHPPTRR